MLFSVMVTFASGPEGLPRESNCAPSRNLRQSVVWITRGVS